MKAPVTKRRLRSNHRAPVASRNHRTTPAANCKRSRRPLWPPLPSGEWPLPPEFVDLIESEFGEVRDVREHYFRLAYAVAAWRQPETVLPLEVQAFLEAYRDAQRGFYSWRLERAAERAFARASARVQKFRIVSGWTRAWSGRV